MQKEKGTHLFKLLVILVNYNNLRLTEDCIISINKSTVPVDIYAIEHMYTHIMLLNNDTVIAPEMIKELLERCDSSCAVTPCMYYYDKPEVIWFAGGRIDRKRGVVVHKFQNTVQKELQEEDCGFATGCCFMMTVDVAERVGELRDEYFMYCEDLDYSIRIARAGIRIRFIPTAKLWHKVGSSSGSESSSIGVYYGTRNRLDIINRNQDIFSWTALPYTYITRYIKALIYRLKGAKTAGLFVRAMRDYRKGISGKVQL